MHNVIRQITQCITYIQLACLSRQKFGPFSSPNSASTESLDAVASISIVDAVVKELTSIPATVVTMGPVQNWGSGSSDKAVVSRDDRDDDSCYVHDEMACDEWPSGNDCGG